MRDINITTSRGVRGRCVRLERSLIIKKKEKNCSICGKKVYHDEVKLGVHYECYMDKVIDDSLKTLYNNIGI